ncbi:MAG: SpoVR family protein [Thiolinea sp.]
MYDEGLVNEGFMMEFLTSHSNVVMQPGFDSPYYSGINPYALGFAMMRDIRRICEHPDEEDRRWFPNIAGSDWISTLDHVMRNFRDESFILQFMSPKIMRDFHFFALEDDDRRSAIDVTAIHNDEGYRRLRETLSQQYNLSHNEPDIQVESVNLRGDRSLSLHHHMHERRPLNNDCYEMLRHVHRLWGYDIHLHSVDTDGRRVRSYHLQSDGVVV